MLSRNRLEYWFSSEEDVLVAAGQQRQNALFRGRSATRDGDVQYLDATLSAKPVQFPRTLWEIVLISNTMVPGRASANIPAGPAKTL